MPSIGSIKSRTLVLQIEYIWYLKTWAQIVQVDDLMCSYNNSGGKQYCINVEVVLMSNKFWLNLLKTYHANVQNTTLPNPTYK